jgi:hypothetical protein
MDMMYGCKNLYVVCSVSIKGIAKLVNIVKTRCNSVQHPRYTYDAAGIKSVSPPNHLVS